MSTRGSAVTLSSENSESAVLRPTGSAVELGVPVGDGPDEAAHRREERLHGGRARLGQRGGAVNPVVDDDQDAAPGRVLVRRHRHRVVEVERAVRRQRRGRAHRGGQHDRLPRLDDEVQEVGRLLDRVGAVRDDDAGDVGHRDQLVDAAGELEPHLVVHVLRADVRDLLAAQVGELLRLRDGRQQLLHAHLAGRVAGLDVARRGAGDGAAGGEHDDGRQGPACALGVLGGRDGDTQRREDGQREAGSDHIRECAASEHDGLSY